MDVALTKDEGSYPLTVPGAELVRVERRLDSNYNRYWTRLKLTNVQILVEVANNPRRNWKVEVEKGFV